MSWVGVHLRPQLLEQRAVPLDQAAVLGRDIEGGEEVRIFSVMDDQAVGAVDIQP